MSLLLKNALVLDPLSTWHKLVCNILIENGFIKSLNGSSASTELDLAGKPLSIGWFDLNANFNDPGNEFKEDISSGSRAALKGGFTDVHLVPATNPPIETKSAVEYINRRALPEVTLHVSAAISKGMQGTDLTEVRDLVQAGAKSFCDGDLPIWNSELLLKSLQYTASIGCPIIQNPSEAHLSKNTHMHEGVVSTNLGLRGEPSLSEELIIMRDLEILKYAGGRIHFSRLSTSRSVELIKEAKQQGLNVTADVSIHHLLFTDASIGDFNTIFKNQPPYRSESDRMALIEGVKTGVIDAICSNHRPQDQESKQLEFDLAETGSISLQTFYSSMLQLSDTIPMDTLIERIAYGSRTVLGVEAVSISEGMPAKITILDPSASWKMDDSTNESKCRNSPFWGQQMMGKVVGTINGDSYALFGI